jgi:alkanesulfonate monooxygenase SsuD/methylene tetrahydromethanopterin reductase-like flavin-dependent oxidoreductase (luciferase family)
VAQLREAVQVIRAVLSGERVTFEGEFYRIRNFRLTLPLPPRPVRLYLGALGPKMLELAGEVADGVLLNWLAPETVERSLPHLEQGARRAGRSLADFEIAAFVRTCVTDDAEAARRWLARDITGYAIVDAYARFFSASGYAEEVEAINRAWKAGDRAGAVTQVSARFLAGLGNIGAAEACRQRIAEFAKAGLTMPVVFPFSPDSDPRPSLLRTVRTFP